MYTRASGMAITALRSRAFSQLVIAAAGSRSSSGRSTKAAVSRMRATTTSCNVTQRQTTRRMPRCRELRPAILPPPPPSLFPLSFPTRFVYDRHVRPVPSGMRSRVHWSCSIERSTWRCAQVRGLDAGAGGAWPLSRTPSTHEYTARCTSRWPRGVSCNIELFSRAHAEPHAPTLHASPACGQVRGEIRPVSPTRPGRGYQWDSSGVAGVHGRAPSAVNSEMLSR